MLKSLLPPRWRLTIWSISQSSRKSFLHIAQRNCCLAAIFFEMKGVTRLRRVDVDAVEVWGTTSRCRWSGAASGSCLLGLALVFCRASARGGDIQAFRFQTASSSTGGSKRPAVTLESNALMVLSLNSLRGFRQEHSSTSIRIKRYHIIMFGYFTLPAKHGSSASAKTVAGCLDPERTDALTR